MINNQSSFFKDCVSEFGIFALIGKFRRLSFHRMVMITSVLYNVWVSKNDVQIPASQELNFLAVALRFNDVPMHNLFSMPIKSAVCNLMIPGGNALDFLYSLHSIISHM